MLKFICECEDVSMSECVGVSVCECVTVLVCGCETRWLSDPLTHIVVLSDNLSPKPDMTTKIDRNPDVEKNQESKVIQNQTRAKACSLCLCRASYMGSSKSNDQRKINKS